ncbi:zinc-ribbon domain-containing protein [soil metagenome]
MILTCPACATRYSVAEGAVPHAGRTVRCASCAHSWHATPESADAAPAAMRFDAEPAFAGAGASAAPIPKQFRAKVQAERQTRQAVTAGVVWAVLGAAFVTILAGAALFRVQVVRLIPQTAGAYAAVHLPVNPVGLALEGVAGGPGLQDGRAVLVVTGSQRNVETAARPLSALRVSLFDKSGHVVASQVLPAPGGRLAPGDTRPFKATFADPPIAAAEFGVDFAFDVKPLPAARPHAAAPALRSARLEPPHPEPLVVREATPIPAGSPYALPEHATPEPAAAHEGH